MHLKSDTIGRIFIFVAWPTFLMALTACANSPGPLMDSGHWVDLTHAFSEETIYWPNAEHFHLTKIYDGHTSGGYHYSANQFEAAEHGGTHMDAPIHFDVTGKAVDRVGLTQIMGNAVVVDIVSKVSKDRDYMAEIQDFLDFEKLHGPIPKDAIVLIRTGYERFWPDPARYLGTAERGDAAIPLLHFPGLSQAGAKWLIESRAVRAVGLDTASIDPGPSKSFESHRVLAANQIPIFENLAELSSLPPTGAFVLALPMKIKGGSGAPLRAIAWVPSPD